MVASCEIFLFYISISMYILLQVLFRQRYGSQGRQEVKHSCLFRRQNSHSRSPVPLALTIFPPIFPPLFCVPPPPPALGAGVVLWVDGLGLGTLRSLVLCIWLVSVTVHLRQREVSLVSGKNYTDLWIEGQIFTTLTYGQKDKYLLHWPVGRRKGKYLECI